MYDRVKAVATAMLQIGKAYEFGAAGPDAYDCSGSTLAAAAAGGLVLPHNSAMQTQALRVRTVAAGFLKGHWARFWLKPGDLVFYYAKYPDDWQQISHVAMFVGWQSGRRMIVNATGDDRGVEYIGMTQYALPTAYGYVDH